MKMIKGKLTWKRALLAGCVLGTVLIGFCIEHSQPRIVTPRDVNLGEVLPKAEVTGRIVIENRGLKSLEILALKPSCSCTAAEMNETKITPHSSTELRFTVRIPNSLGKFESSIGIESTDPSRPHVVIPIRFDMEPLVTVFPDRLSLWNLEQKSLPKKFEVLVKGIKTKVKAARVRSPVEWVIGREVESGAHDGQVELEFTVTENAPSGQIEIPIEVSIVMETGATDRQFVVVGGTVQKGVTAIPEIIFGLASSVEGERVLVPSGGRTLVAAVFPEGAKERVSIGGGEDGSWCIKPMVSRGRTAFSGSVIFSDAITSDPVASVPFYFR
jgi:hypothetical protein